MTKSSSPDLQSRIREVSEQLDREFQGRVPAAVVTECIRTARVRVAEVRIPDFAPIFFVRHARRMLREAAAAPTKQSAVA